MHFWVVRCGWTFEANCSATETTFILHEPHSPVVTCAAKVWESNGSVHTGIHTPRTYRRRFVWTQCTSFFFLPPSPSAPIHSSQVHFSHVPIRNGRHFYFLGHYLSFVRFVFAIFLTSIEFSINFEKILFYQENGRRTLWAGCASRFPAFN